ncbi:MAG TPA: branched-chain amino acid ABC transporter permease [Syntrophales bacterium]|nr:branched-chain amino acid ABC transporter permease [Syntrophales bacterium]HOL58745.1 branched-chain amino acid ABC transporter permease [Syntrophales bacterium]HPO34967.1 branched-chain amino acid ABC transporter permease [Syntrophales bacterium]
MEMLVTYVQQVLIYGFVLGAIYLLISLGFSLICGVLRIFHLGYAYIFPVTVYCTWMFMKEFGWGLVSSMLGMVVIQFVLAWIIYIGIIKRYIEREEIQLTGLLLVALIVEQVANYFYPIQEAVYLSTTLKEGTVTIGSVVIPWQLLLGGIISLVMTGLFILFFLKTKEGMAVRAISQNIYTSEIVGINVEVLYVFIMMVVLLPVIIGMLLVAPIWNVEPGMGWLYQTTAILVAVLGGLGNIKGTILASFLIGLTHAVMCNILGEPRFMNLSALVLVMIILVIRPQGLARSESIW